MWFKAECFAKYMDQCPALCCNLILKIFLFFNFIWKIGVGGREWRKREKERNWCFALQIFSGFQWRRGGFIAVGVSIHVIWLISRLWVLQKDAVVRSPRAVAELCLVVLWNTTSLQHTLVKCFQKEWMNEPKFLQEKNILQVYMVNMQKYLHYKNLSHVQQNADTHLCRSGCGEGQHGPLQDQ